MLRRKFLPYFEHAFGGENLLKKLLANKWVCLQPQKCTGWLQLLLGV